MTFLMTCAHSPLGCILGFKGQKWDFENFVQFLGSKFTFLLFWLRSYDLKKYRARTRSALLYG